MRRSLGLALATLLAAGLLSACSGRGNALAKQACGSVDKAVASYQRAAGETGQAAADLRDQGNRHLMDAQALAAQATSADGSFNALMTTLQERNQVGVDRVLPLLEATCKTLRSNLPYIIAPSGGGGSSSSLP